MADQPKKLALKTAGGGQKIPTGNGSDVQAATALPASALFQSCDAELLGRAIAAEKAKVPDVVLGAIGQDRAIEAVNFAVGIRHRGYNVYALGPTGTGRHDLIRDLLERQAANDPTPDDWCYVNNFADAHHPRVLRLPAGRAIPFRDAMKRLIAELRAALPAAFERDDYRTRREVLEHQLKQKHEEAFGELQKRCEAKDITLLRTPLGLTLAPVRNGEVIRPADFDTLPEAKREEIKTNIEALQAELEAVVRRIPEWEREHRDAMRDLNRETTAAAIGFLIRELRGKYDDLPAVLAYLDAVEHDIQEHADDFLAAGRAGAEGGAAAVSEIGPMEAPSFRRYQVNVMVKNGEHKGAPVVYEDHPTHQTLVGRIEHIARFGTLMTDFNLLVPGALHRSNGGYLIIDAERLITGSFAWESLKRALRSATIRTESIEQLLSLASTVSLDPEPIPLNVKVMLIGSPVLYYLLSEYDPEFGELFKIAADFDDRIDRGPTEMGRYGLLLSAICQKQKLKQFDDTALARVVEYAARLSGDATKLSTNMRSLTDLLLEADHCAAIAGAERVSVDSVQGAIDGRRRRSDRIYRRFQEEVGRETIRLETDGEQVGQVNGLSVISVGGIWFGHPSRITAKVRLGRGEVIDIERETDLGGPLHSKGVMILSGFLGGRFGAKGPLALNASLVFEQSYGGIEGDSASSAELFALISAIADVPVRQSLAVTGSVDQRGQIQAVGGINEKVEGFFDVCKVKGFSGHQGVIIPAANAAHLMLRRDVVEAAAAGQFRIYAIESVDQGIELLTGLAAGAADLTGAYPADSVNGRIATRLRALAERAQELARAPRQD